MQTPPNPHQSQPDPTISLLLVEDSASDASLVQRMLGRTSAAYQIGTAERLSEAIATARRQVFDVAILDLTLPDSDGVTTVERFVAEVPNVPTIVLTVLDDEALALSAITYGAQDYLIKDEISPDKLTRAIRYSIERGRLMNQIQAANKELEAFSYSAAHDLKAPLRGIVGLADLVLDEASQGVTLGETAQAYIAQIRANAMRMDQLVTALLKYSRIRTTSIETSAVDLELSISDALAQLQSDIERQGADINVQLPLPKVMGYGPMVVQAIANLVGNAIKFTAPGVRPRVDLWAEERSSSGQSSVRLWVRDNGIGIDPAHREKIFSVFERLNNQREYEGSGIGLAITQEAIIRMEGRCGVESQLGQGSQFWFELPKA
ncbi:MAG: ATP-binding protein [Cyanobacteria bacterium P01_A01_bin.135]